MQNNDKTSKFEKLIRKVLSTAFPNDVAAYNERPDFLKNEKTGKNFELDIWYKSLGFAVECNGVHHGFMDKYARDKFKKAKCLEQGINLIQIEKPRDVFWMLKQLLPERRVRLPRGLVKEITSYPTVFKKRGNLEIAASIEKGYRNAYDKQLSETEAIRRRMEIRGTYKAPLRTR
jgi:hypothetical protein